MEYIHRMPLMLPLCGWILGIYASEKFEFSPPSYFLYIILLVSVGIFLFNQKISQRCVQTGLCILFFVAFFVESSILYQCRRPCVISSNEVSFEAVYREELGRGGVVESDNGVLFYVSLDTIFMPGDVLYLQGRVVPILGSTSGDEVFSYDDFLRKQNVCHRIYVDRRPMVCGRESSVYYKMQEVRSLLLEKCALLLPDTLHRGVVEALCLGYKRDLDSRIQELFQETGTIHLLAVSGLHTGAIFLLISWLLKCVRVRNRYVRVVLIVLLLWGYACVTGLPPSVVRAALILTFITIWQAFRRDYLPINAIAGAAFLSLVVNPFALWSVSMQMSYAAYCGIILLYPLIYRMAQRVFMPNYIRSLLCMSLAAQISTFPLCMVYFNNVNLTGLISNLVAIPLTTVLLYVATMMLFLPIFLAEYINVCVDGLVYLLQMILTFLRTYSFNIKQIYINDSQMFILYWLLLAIVIYPTFRNRRSFVFMIIPILVLLISVCYDRYKQKNKQEIVVFNSYRGSNVVLNNHGMLSLYASFQQRDVYVENYTKGQHVDTLTNNSFLWKDECVKILDKKQTEYCVPNSTLIISQNIYPSYRLDSQRISKIIISGGMKPKIMAQWKKWSEQRRISCQNAAIKEYTIISLQ